MKSLIWKEWRETRWIAIGFLLICLLTSVCWKVTCPGEEQGWHAAIWTLLAVGLGAGAFASEKQATTMEFLAAKPLRKTHLWAFKAAWGFGVLLVIVGISSVLDYLLMLSDPFYTAWHLLVGPVSWLFLVLLAFYAVALLSSTVSDKTVLAVGFAIVIGAAVACAVALIARFSPNFFMFVNEPWGIPLALLWFSMVVLAGSFLIVAWREVWPNYPSAVKRGAIGVGVGTVIVLLILSSANIPVDRITRITYLVASRTRVVFSGEAAGRRLSRWEVDVDGEKFTKTATFPHDRRHPARGEERAEVLHDRMLIMPIHRGENAGGYVIEKVARDRFHAIPRRVRTTIQPVNGATLSWLGVWDEIHIDTGTFDQFYFVEELPSGERHVRVTYPEGEEAGLTARMGILEAISPSRSRFIFSTPSEANKILASVMTSDARRRNPTSSLAEMDKDVQSSFSFATDQIVQYELGGKTFLADADSLDAPGFEIPEDVLARGPGAVRRLARGRGNKKLRRARDVPRVAPVLESVAAGWGMDLPEELFDEAIFLVPRGRQIIYLKKADEQRSSLWTLDIESGESTRILDDIDVTSPAVPKALIAPIMDDHFVFVRDAKTIWTYRDGTLKQIFPPED